MSSNYHTNIIFDAPADAKTFNDPDGQLDLAISNLITGDQPFQQINLGSPGSSLIISASTITVTKDFHTVDTGGGAANLATINGGVTGDVLWLNIANNANPVTVQHNVGNVFLSDAANRLLDNTNKLLVLRFNGSKWVDDYKTAVALSVRDLINSTPISFTALNFPRGVPRSSGPGAGGARSTFY